MKATKRALALTLAIISVVSLLPVSVFAGFDYAHNEAASSDDYYSIISKTDWDIAPGITETEIVLNNEAGDRRQVVHMMEADLTNPYTRVISSYTNMDTSNYAISTIPEHAAYIENEWGENVVGAMNTCLSWYNTAVYAQNPERVNEPLGFMMVDGDVYFDHSVGFPTCIVIHKDVNEAGETRPADIPKVEMRTVTDSSSLNGWEDQVIPSSSGYIVKDGVNLASPSHGSDTAARSVVGVKADGSVVIMMNDGRQAPYSTGMNMYECAEVMIAAGCIYASNCDGGGSSTFMSQRPGEDLAVNCSPCDGSLRQNTHGIVFISTAPATGEFYNAYLSTENDYYVPYSTVEVTAIGRDFSGAEADIPADAVWSLSDDSFGTLADGVFTSNGKTGEVELRLSYNGEVVGTKTVYIVDPEAVSFAQSSTVIPYGKSVVMDVVATYGAFDVAFDADDFTWELSDESAGTRDGFNFVATNDTTKTGLTVTAKYKYAEMDSFTLDITFGKGSEILYSFEDGDISEWLGLDATMDWAKENNPDSPVLDASPYSGNITDENDSTTFLATAENGKVKNGQYALGVELDYTHSGSFGQWAYSMFFNVGGTQVLRDTANGMNATRLGMWIYIPEELAPGHNLAMQAELYCGSSSTNFTRKNTHLILECNGKTLAQCTEADIPEDRWVYCYMDLSAYNYVAIQDSYTAISTRREPQFIRFYTQSKEPFNSVLYIDDITLDYSSAVDDRNAPVISNINVNTTGATVRNFSANVADYTASNASGLNYSAAKIYLDGVALDGVSASGSIISSPDVNVLPGSHTVTFEITDNKGNVTKESSDFTVSGTAPVTVGGHNDLGNTPEYDSVYYVDIKADDVDNVNSLTADIYLNFANTWELDHMIVADGFEAEYTVDEHTNVATVTVTKTGDDVAQTDTLVSLPVRVWSWDAEAAGYTADKIAASSYPLVYIKTDVRKGAVEFADGSTGTFNGGATVDTAILASVLPSAWHVHTETALEDKDSTCLTAGYAGRTYCEVCGSVVAWGETIPAKGHDWKVDEDGVLSCANGGELFNGIYTDGKTYVDGVLIADGWFEVEGVKTYYVDGVKATGSLFIDGEMYTFDENGALLPGYKYEGFYETADGKYMYFMNNKYVTGLQKIAGVFYNFDKNGYAFDGEVELCGEICLFEDGVSVESETIANAGMCGENAEYVVCKDGRMIIGGYGPTMECLSVGSIPWYTKEIKQYIKTLTIGKDITVIGTRLCYYIVNIDTINFEEGSKLETIQGVAFAMGVNLKDITLPEGLEQIYGNAFKDCPNLTNVYIPTSVTGINKAAFKNSPNVVLNVVEGSYAHSFAVSNGIAYKLVDNKDTDAKNGVVKDEDGKIRYYQNGAVVARAGLVYYEGYYYYFNSSNTAVVNCTYGVSKTNDLLPAGGYKFDEEGRMIDPPAAEPEPTVKNGVIKDADGKIRYYQNDAVVARAGLVYYEGYYYYFNSSNTAVVNCTYGVSKTNDLLPAGGYKFDEEGRMIDPPVKKNGVIKSADGKIYYYVDDVMVKRAGLVYYEGYYYYFNSSNTAVVNCMYGVSKTNDLLPAGAYRFDAEGHMINPPVA